MMDRPENLRSIISNDKDRLQITIPVKKNWLLIVLNSAWLCFWLPFTLLFFYSMVVAFVREPVNREAILVLLFFFILVAGSLIGIKKLWWQLKGLEIITVDRCQLSIERKNALFERTGTFELTKIVDLCAHDERDDLRPWQKKGGLVYYNMMQFCYYGNTIKFADRISEEEAGYLVALIDLKITGSHVATR